MLSNRDKRWTYLTDGLKRHWPNLTDIALNSTGGDFHKVLELITSKYGLSENEVRPTLETVFEETKSGNPNSIDKFEGIEKFQRSPSRPFVSEWNARQDVNPEESQ